MPRPDASRAAEPRLARTRAAVPALACGAAHALAFAPWGAWWLHLPTLAALGFLLARALDRPRRAVATAAGVGFAFGMGWFVVGIGWLFVSMHTFGKMPAVLAALAVLLFAAYLALFPAAGAAIAARIGGGPLGRGLAIGSALTLAELGRGYLFTGFPWLSFGYAQVDGPLGGFAPVLGVYGVGWIATTVAAGVGTALAARPASAAPVAVRAVLPALAVLALAIAAGQALRTLTWTVAHGRPIAVRLVQGNIAQQLKFDPAHTARNLEGYVRQVESIDAGQVFVLLPETAWTVPWSATPPALARRLANFVRTREAAVAIGLPQFRPIAEAGGRTRQAATNSVLMLAPSGPPAQYDKRHLVPFGEFIPWGFRWFVALMEIPLGDFDRGRAGQAPFAFGGQRIAPNICYEDVYGEELIDALHGPQGATILANVTNVAWFGRSHAMDQHLQIAQMRALETGRPMIRATNTGVTAAIDHDGRVIARLAPFTAGIAAASIQGRTGLTPFARFGNGFASGLGLAGLVVAFALARRRRIRGLR